MDCPVKSSHRFCIAAAVYSGFLAWLFWLVLLTGDRDAGAETVSIIKPTSDEVRRADDGFVDWRGEERCTPRKRSSTQGNIWTARTLIRDQPGPQLAWTVFRCSDDSRTRFARVAVNSHSFQPNSTTLLRKVAHLHVSTDPTRGELNRVFAHEVERHLKLIVEPPVSSAKTDWRFAGIQLQIESINISDLRLEVEDGFGIWARLHFQGTGMMDDCEVCFVPNPFTFSGHGVFRMKVRVDHETNSTMIVRDSSGNNPEIRLDSFMTDIEHLKNNPACETKKTLERSVLKKWLSALLRVPCINDFRMEDRIRFENAVAKNLQTIFDTFLAWGG